jgi:hypothetical protein
VLIKPVGSSLHASALFHDSGYFMSRPYRHTPMSSSTARVVSSVNEQAL